MSNSSATYKPPDTIMSFGRSSLIGRSRFIRYGAATLLLITAALLRIGLSSLIGRPISAPIFIAAIVFCTWIGGWRLGIFSSIAAGGFLAYYFVQSQNVVPAAYDQILRASLFAAEGSFLSWLIDKLRIFSDELTISREELRELAEHQRSMREAEQKRIALEVHDELGQALTNLKLDIHMVRRNAQVAGYDKLNSAVVDGLENLSDQVDKTIGSVRRIASELHPSILDDLGLVAAIEWQAKEFERKSGIRSQFMSDSDSIEAGPDTSIAIFRICQEALTNVARHSKAANVNIEIGSESGKIRMCVEDNGVGIDLEVLSISRALGILGMQERARLVGAEFSIVRGERGGTKIELSAPISKNGK